MKIKDIKDPKIQQMAVVETIKQNPNFGLDEIMQKYLIGAFVWRITPQGDSFWKDVHEMKPFKYSEFGLFFKSTQGIFKQPIDNLEFRCANDLATPEEVYNHLKQKDVENKPKQEPICNDWEAYGTQLEQEVEDLKLKIANLEANKDLQSLQIDKLNKLVDEIESNCEDQTNPRMKLNAIHRLIHNYRNPSVVGTTQTVEIDGKKYEVTINKEI